MGQKSVEWIAQIAPSSTYRNIFDLGVVPAYMQRDIIKKDIILLELIFLREQLNMLGRRQGKEIQK